VSNGSDIPERALTLLEFIAVELFPCAGGMAEGFRRAGITFDLAFDFSADACASYEANLGHRPIQMDVRDLLRMVTSGVSLGQIDLLVADPPCTPWSRAGKRKGLDDEHDMLRETCALIGLLRPTCWLIGNVPGLDDGTNANAVAATIGALSRSGYDVDYAKLNASSYGVPQHRVRPFWFGRPRGSEPLRWPAPTHGAPGNLALPGCALKPWVTCRDALEHLPLPELGRPVRVKWKRDTDHKTATPDDPAPTATRNTHGDGALLAASVDGGRNNHPPSTPNSPARTVTGSDGGGVKGHTLTWPWDVPATTVTQDDRLAPPGHHPESVSVLSVPNAVVLSEKARAILQGFPEDWKFLGDTKKSRSSMIGMAMPPPMAEAVAKSITRWFAAWNAAERRTA
jgi:DNA (cytosine-5)-methyltransferase 1